MQLDLRTVPMLFTNVHLRMILRIYTWFTQYEIYLRMILRHWLYFGRRGLVVKAAGWLSLDRQFEPYLRAYTVAPSWCGLGCRSRTLMVEYIDPRFFLRIICRQVIIHARYSGYTHYLRMIVGLRKSGFHLRMIRMIRTEQFADDVPGTYLTQNLGTRYML